MTVGTESTFPMSAFIAGAVTTAIPGIILQIVVIPILVLILEKYGFTQGAKNFAGTEKTAV